jgi:hypothetical protein
MYKRLIKIIREKNPKIIILNKEYKSLQEYFKDSGYNINNLHCYYYNDVKNRISVSFADSYTLKKMQNIV